MASNLDREGLLARIGINLVLTRVSGIFKALTSFAYSQRFSAPLGARKCLSPIIEKIRGNHGRIVPTDMYQILDVLQKSIFNCRGEAFAFGLIGEIRVLISKCFALFGFMQEVYSYKFYKLSRLDLSVRPLCPLWFVKND